MPPRTREAIFSGFQNSHGKSRSTSPLSLSRVKEVLSSRGRKPHPKRHPHPWESRLFGGYVGNFAHTVSPARKLRLKQVGKEKWKSETSLCPTLLLALFLRGDSSAVPWTGELCCCYWSFAKSSLILCDPMDCSTQGFPVLHKFLRVPQGCSENPVPCFWAPTLGLALLRSSLSSVRFSGSVVSDSLWPHGLQHARPPCPSPTPWACSSSCPSSRWCHPTISSSVIPFSSHLRSFSASGSFPVCWLFVSGGQSTGASSSASVLWWIFRVDFL